MGENAQHLAYCASAWAAVVLGGTGKIQVSPPTTLHQQFFPSVSLEYEWNLSRFFHILSRQTSASQKAGIFQVCSLFIQSGLYYIKERFLFKTQISLFSLLALKQVLFNNSFIHPFRKYIMSAYQVRATIEHWGACYEAI